MQRVARWVIIAFAFAMVIGTISTEGFAYDSHGKRNPFVPPAEVTPSVRQEDLIETGHLEQWFKRNLGGVIWDPQSPYVLLGDEIVSVGDKVQGCMIIEIKSESMIFDYKGKRVEVPFADE